MSWRIDIAMKFRKFGPSDYERKLVEKYRSSSSCTSQLVVLFALFLATVYFFSYVERASRKLSPPIQEVYRTMTREQVCKRLGKPDGEFSYEERTFLRWDFWTGTGSEDSQVSHRIAFEAGEVVKIIPAGAKFEDPRDRDSD